MLWFPVQIQDRRHATVADITFRGPYTWRNSHNLVNHRVSTFKRFIEGKDRK